MYISYKIFCERLLERHLKAEELFESLQVPLGQYVRLQNHMPLDEAYGEAIAEALNCPRNFLCEDERPTPFSRSERAQIEDYYGKLAEKNLLV